MISIMSYRTPFSTAVAIQRRDLLLELVSRDMKLRYKRSVLGMLWSLLNPLAQLLVFVFLFRRVMPLDIPDYPTYVFAGLIVWSWFQSSLVAAAASIVGNRELLRRPGFPTAILPVVVVTTSLVHFLLAFPILLLFLVTDRNVPALSLVALPVLIAVQFTLTLGLSYVVAALQVVFGDTQHLLGVGLLVLFYLTPVFYRAADVPEQYRPIYRLNPIAPFVMAFRDIMLFDRMPGLAELLIVTAISGGCLWGGYLLFSLTSSRFVEEL